MLHYDGEIVHIAEDPPAAVGIGNLLNLSGGHVDWASMNACVQQVSWRVDHGETTVQFGSPRQIGVTDRVQMALANRRRNAATSAPAKTSSSVENKYIVLSGDDSKENSTHGGEKVLKQEFGDPEKDGKVTVDGEERKITLGKDSSKVELDGNNATVVAGDSSSGVKIDGKESKIRAGDDSSGVKIDGKECKINATDGSTSVKIDAKECTIVATDGSSTVKVDGKNSIVSVNKGASSVIINGEKGSVTATNATTSLSLDPNAEKESITVYTGFEVEKFEYDSNKVALVLKLKLKKSELIKRSNGWETIKDGVDEVIEKTIVVNQGVYLQSVAVKGTSLEFERAHGHYFGKYDNRVIPPLPINGEECD